MVTYPGYTYGSSQGWEMIPMKTLTVSEAAAMARVDPRTLRRALKKGLAPGTRINGKIWRLPVRAFEVWLAGGDWRQRTEGSDA